MKTIAFYLPQYHPIPENNLWWGNGFTDWVNVAKARPLFKGHYQPQVPADLGFYDLRNSEIIIAQAQMAKRYGVDGFCFYHYWFNGKLLLEKPVNEMLRSGLPEFPFCLCWANENWTRRWDGKDQDVLISQDYTKYDPISHIQWLIKAFTDKRYIKVNGKPLFAIYDVDSIPNIGQVIQGWRNEITKASIPDIYICAVRSQNCHYTSEQLKLFGFDSIIEFRPIPSEHPKQMCQSIIRNLPLRLFNKIALFLGKKIPPYRIYHRYQYNKYAQKAVKYLQRSRTSQLPILPVVFPSWDNSPRKRMYATIIQNENPKDFGDWLSNSIKWVKQYPAEERILFINAWNEWAEGCHLEPDTTYGTMFLKEVERIRSINK